MWWSSSTRIYTEDQKVEGICKLHTKHIPTFFVIIANASAVHLLAEKYNTIKIRKHLEIAAKT